MKKSLKVLALVLSIITIASVFTACASSGTQQDTTAPAAGTSSTNGDSGENAETTYYVEDKLGTMNLGETINVLAWADVEHEEFESEGTTGDLVNDSIFTRNERVCSRLGVTINWIREKGDADYRVAWNQKVGNVISAGDHSYDVVAGYSLAITLDASSGYLYNMLDEDNCSYLDFTAPWWSQLLIDQCTIKGKLYFGSGDISRNALEMMYVCFVNKDILENHNLQNPQDLVDENKWTYAKFIEMCQGVYEGTGEKDETTDTFGYMCQGIHYDPWFYGSGASICSVNADGNFVESETFFGEKVINTIDMVHKLLDSQDGMRGSSAGKHQTAFRDGRLLFCTDRARCSHKVFAANSDCHYYVVPFPKYDEEQERYYTVMGNPFTLYGIMSDCTKLKACSAFVEAMASEGYRNVTPAVFELSLKTKYVEDPKSAAMYDIVRESLTYDAGRLFSTDLVGQGDFRNAISSTVNNWSSLHKTMQKTLSQKCKALNKSFD